MLLQSVTDQSAWDAFVASQPWSQFTQSWQWGEFKRSRGHVIERLALMNEAGTWMGAGLWMYTSKYLISGYWYAQRGPIVKDKEALGNYLAALLTKGFSKKSMFWRCEPPLVAMLTSLASGIEVHRAHAFQPAATLLVDLTHSEEQLLACMHEKTRYNIRLAERHGVTVREACDAAAMEIFLRLHNETAQRDRFVSMPSAYIRATFEFLSKHNMARVRIAEHEGDVLAASVEILYGDTITYLYGASSSTKRHLMGPYALHWSAIRSAKRLGYKFYDFHGVNPEDPTSWYWKSSWRGISRFKEGFGGERRELVGTWEMPRSPLYAVLEILRRRFNA